MYECRFRIKFVKHAYSEKVFTSYLHKFTNGLFCAKFVYAVSIFFFRELQIAWRFVGDDELVTSTPVFVPNYIWFAS